MAPFHQLFKAEKPIKFTNDIMNSFNSSNKSLDNACGLWLKQPMPNRQYILITDANVKNAGYALMIEENTEEKITSMRKRWHLVPKCSLRHRLKCPYTRKNSWPSTSPSWSTATFYGNQLNRLSSSRTTNL